MKNIFEKMKSSIAVVTTSEGDRINGCTVAWFSRVSIEPALIMVSIAPERLTADMILKTGRFGVNILSETQLDIAKLFGFKKGRDTNKFENTPYHINDGLPVIDDTSVYIGCELYSIHKAGDHILFIGEIKTTESSDKKPLIYDRKDFLK